MQVLNELSRKLSNGSSQTITGSPPNFLIPLYKAIAPTGPSVSKVLFTGKPVPINIFPRLLFINWAALRYDPGSIASYKARMPLGFLSTKSCSISPDRAFKLTLGLWSFDLAKSRWRRLWASSILNCSKHTLLSGDS